VCRTFHACCNAGTADIPATQSTFFWLMVTLNRLSLVLGWITHSHFPGVFVNLVVLVFTIGNVVMDSHLMWRLVDS